MAPNTTLIDYDAIRREFETLDAPRLLLTALAAIPWAIGWLVGQLWALLLWCVAALIAGFKAGRGETA